MRGLMSKQREQPDDDMVIKRPTNKFILPLAGSKQEIPNGLEKCFVLSCDLISVCLGRKG